MLTLSDLESQGNLRDTSAKLKQGCVTRKGRILTCKFCERVFKRVWARREAWEIAHSNEGELWADEKDENRQLVEDAYAIIETDPSAAFQLFLDAAEAGSIWSLHQIGRHYETGTGVAEDSRRALEYYHRAVCGGSWMATLDYARCLSKLEYHEECESVLRDGVESGFIPAYFWLAQLRYDQSKTREVCTEVRPVLEHAANEGHPEAQLLLARWMVGGKFGRPEIGGGMKWLVRYVAQSAGEAPDEGKVQEVPGQQVARS